MAPLLIAHRGAHLAEPENTLAAFAAAAADGADLVELDVRRTADGALAIFHDPEIDRRPVGSLDLTELSERAGIEVPTLEAVLAWAAQAGVGLDVELKEDGYVEELVPMLTAFPGRLVVTSFLDPVIARLGNLAPGLERGLIVSLTTLGLRRRLGECGAPLAVIEARLLEERRLAELAADDTAVWVWDFLPTTPGAAAWLADPRIAAVITDDVPGTRALALTPR